jgi:transposase
MMGQQTAGQNSLFYDFCLEQHIPENHLLRRIDSFLDFDQLRYHLFPYYSLNGRPSIDPELMIRMLLIGYCYGIRSERRLCEEVNYNLAYRWFCRLGLQGDVPNHSTFSKNRLRRFRESEVFRLVFNTVVSRCIDEGLVKGEGFAIDASFVRADASRQRFEEGPVDWTPSPEQSRPVREYLEALDDDPSLRRTQKSVSLTDPMSQFSGAKGRAEFYYSTNYLIDVENGVIMDVEGSPSTRTLEVATTKTMIERVEDNHGIVPDRLMGDTAYGSAENLGYLVTEKEIEPHIPVWDKSNRSDGTYSAEDFIYIHQSDHYVCPEGKFVKYNRRNLIKPSVTQDNTMVYRSAPWDCKKCPSKDRCCRIEK